MGLVLDFLVVVLLVIWDKWVELPTMVKLALLLFRTD